MQLGGGGRKKTKYTYAYDNAVTDRQMTMVNKCLTHPRGWASKGYRFVQVLLRDTQDITIHFKNGSEMARMFRRPDLRNLSVTATLGHASDVYFHLGNWNSPPAAFQARSHRKNRYRMYLVNHEIGHCLGFGHVTADEVARQAAKQRRLTNTQVVVSCPIMLQQSVHTLPLCRSNPFVT